MEQIQVDVDVADALLLLGNAERKMAYAIANAINAVALKIQAAERARVVRVLHVRKSEFILREVAVIKPFASAPQRRFEALISVGQKPRLQLSKFEAGGQRGPFVGRHVALPVIGGARPSIAMSVDPALFVKALALRRVGGRRGGGPIEGALSTYLVPRVGIFQRLASGASRILYFFKDVWRIPRKLGFIETARAVADANFQDELLREVREALEHSGGIR
jgi:hypothetical protein